MNFALLQNSVVVAGSSALLASCFGVAGAIFAAGVGRKLRGIAIGSAVLSLILPPFLITNTWLKFFGLAGTLRPYLDLNLYSLAGTVWLITLSLWPVAFLLVLGSILRIQSVYLEQEPHLRGTALLRYLVWPATRGAIALGFALSFVLALNNFSIPVLLQTKVYTEEVWLAFSTRFDYATALKLSWPLILGPLLVVGLVRLRPVDLLFRSRDFSPRLFFERSRGYFWVGAAIFALVCFLSVLVPAFQLIVNARTWAEFFPAIAAGSNAAFHSLLFAGGAALCLGLAGLSLRKTGSAFWTWLFFLSPGVLLGIALIWIFNRPPLTAFYQSAGIVALAYLLRFLAIAWSAARLAFLGADRVPGEVVAIHNGNAWAQFRLAEWPQSKWLLLGGIYLLYLFCLWEVETLLLIVPPGRETLALRVFNMLHYGHAGQVDALCVWLMLFALAPLCVVALISRFRQVASAALGLALMVVITGCSEASANSDAVRSKLFSGVQVIGSRGTGAGQFNKPRSVGVDGNDNLYVVDLTGRVQKFSPDGQYILSWQMPETDKGKAKGMIKDADGNLVVVEPHYSRLNHFDGAGKLVAQWGENGTNESKLQFPRSVAVNSQGDMYVSEYGLVERIQQFSNRGARFVRAFGQPGTAIGELNRAEGIGIGPDDRVYIADSCNHRIQVFAPDGKFLKYFGHAGSGLGELSYPYDVRVDPEGYRYVCEFGNSRVQVFDAQDRSFEILGGAGPEPGQMNNPWAIALDSRGNLYVADSANHRVQKFIRRKPLPVARSQSRSELLLASVEVTP